MKYFLIFFLVLGQLIASGQSNQHHFKLAWKTTDEGQYTFHNAVTRPEVPNVPLYIFKMDIPQDKDISAWLSNVQEKVLTSTLQHSDDIDDTFRLEVWTETTRGQKKAIVAIQTLKKQGDAIHLLTSGTLNIEFKPSQTNTLRGGETESVLSNGTIFKLSISSTGIHQITGSFISSKLGVSLSEINPDRIQIFGNVGGRLPEIIAEERTDDLGEIPTMGVGLDDGTFDPQDKLIFYAEGAGRWIEESGQWNYQTNIYDDLNYVFIKVKGEDRKKITSIPSESLENLRTSYLNLQYYGKDEVNLLGQSISHHGSGQLWFSDELSNSRSIDLSNSFDFSNIVQNSSFRIRSRFYGRSESRTTYDLVVGDKTFSRNMIGTDYDPESTFARKGVIDETFAYDTPINSLRIDFPSVSTQSEGWLDNVNVNCRKHTSSLGYDQILMDTFSTNLGGFDLPATGNTVLLEVSDYHDVYSIEPVIENGRMKFATFQPDRRRFILFNPSQVSLSPELVGEIANQNLHAIQDVDMVIVTHELFTEQAERLAEHRSNYSDLDVEVVSVHDIYNEFSSGRLDPTAIRDFCKMLYDRSSDFKYLLLFGDGSYDWRYQVQSVPDQNFVPVYETEESISPIYAFPTDDFYALLDDDEGDNLRGGLDIATGRLLSRTEEEAKVLVDKIIRYDSAPEALGDWRNRQIYLADDEDSNRHVDDVDRIAIDMQNQYPVFNQDKIYFDAYEQVATPGGARFPDAKAAINSAVFKGGLVMTYLGHGGPTGLAQERVMQTADIRSWSNKNNMPIILTATCSFTGYDDPAITTAGEYSVLNPNGGAIAILSTVRAVFAQDNYYLSDAVHEYLYEKVNGKPIPLGEIMRLAKNSSGTGGTDSNNRKFSLFGDPSMTLALPKYDVITTEINGSAASEFKDTLGSLEQVTVRGFIADNSGSIMSDFNGTIYPTVFDKELTLSTKAQDRRSKVKKFNLRKNTIFKGAATINQGEFEFSFVIPKDINFEIGQGKISYYATDGVSKDANGYYNGLTIGGLGIDTLDDDQPPRVEVFMNDSNFVFGGITNPNPVLYLQLEDDNGINVAGNSIGHDLTAVLDNNTQNTFVLNDFYESEVNNFRKGTVRYPLSNLTEGRHSIAVTVWDIANNFSEGYTEFVVVSNPKGALKHVFNYPNPFMTETNFSFEHTFPAGDMTIEIDIVSVDGKPVKKIIHETTNTGFRVDNITWDGTDETGSPIAKGVYLYKINVKVDVSGTDYEKTSSFERLVVLK